MRRVLQGAANDIQKAYPDDLTMSDVQNYLEDIIEDVQLRVDYPIEVYTKVYINKTLARRKSLPDTTRDNFDLSDIEDKIAQDLNTLGEPISIFRRTAFVYAATKKTGQKVHDLDDFGLIEAGRILNMIEATREQHPRSKIALTVEIRVSITILTYKPQPPKPKCKAPDVKEDASSSMPSSPPIAQKKKKSRTSILEAQ